MNKILSWKIGNGVYAYVCPIPIGENKKTHITKKIPENSPLWNNIISEISGWDRDKYARNFNKMADDVYEKYGIEIPRKESDINKYWGLNDGSNVNIVLLSGDDGNSGNGNSNDSNDSSENITTEDINEILDKIKDEAYARQSAITQYVLAEATKTISEAKSEIAETKEHLNIVRNELEGKLSAATEAVNATKALFDDGDITPEKINDALATISEHGDWVAASSGFITSIRNGADEATKQIGGIANAEDPVSGYFSTIATNINSLSGTVGTVSQTVNASKGLIEDMASWYDTNASAATKAISYINASAGTIGDTLEYINGSGLTTYLNREMDARAMTIKDTIETDFEDSITSVNRVLDGFSGVIKDTVVKYNETAGKLTSLGDEMDATNRRMAKYMNITDDTNKEVMDFRETWTETSGMLTTVGSLIYVQDKDGNATGVVMETHEKYPNEEVIMKMGEKVWRLKNNHDVEIDALYVIPNLSQVIGSFISQTASAVTMGVANDKGTLAQIAMEIAEGENGEGESYINMIANKVQISGQLIAQSLSSNTADIGGIIIGSGQVKTSGNTVVINGNDGSLTAKKGTIGGFGLNENSLNAGLTHILSNSGEDSYSFVSGFSKPKDDEPVLFVYYNEAGDDFDGPFIWVNKEQTEYFLKDKEGNLSKGFKKLSIIDDDKVFLNSVSVDELNGSKPAVKNEIYIKSPKVVDDRNITYKGFKDAFGNDYYYKYSNTYIKNDGTLYSKLLVADNGYFNGEIDATGVFDGDIYSNHGYLKNIILDSPIFKDGLNLPNTVFMESLDNGTDTRYYDKISHNIKKVNKNGDDKGKYYIAEDDNRITIFSIKVNENDKIKLPDIKIELTRYTSGNKQSERGYVDLYYKLGTTTNYLGGVYLGKGGYTQKQSKTINGKDINVTSSGIFSIILAYDIHLSTYSWLGADKSMFNLNINSDSSINVTPTNITKTLVIADDGLRYVTNNYVSGELGYGIEISTDGIKICKNGEWQDL
jgi:hypothetical protein